MYFIIKSPSAMAESKDVNDILVTSYDLVLAFQF